MQWALILASYLLGAFPTAYVVARLARGIDIRQYGSGQVGGSAALVHVGRWALAVVALADVGKGMLPPALALHLGWGLPVAVLAAWAAVVGHNWSIYLGFRGGRGVATGGGALLLLAPRETLILLPAFVLGVFLGWGPVVVLGILLVFPALAWIMGEPPALVWGIAALCGTVLLKRILGDTPRSLVHVLRHPRILLYRVLFDRDVRDGTSWLNRRPPGEVESHT